MSLSGAEVGLCVESFWLSRTLTLARLAAAAAVQISASRLLQQLLLGPIQRLLVRCGEEEEEDGGSECVGSDAVDYEGHPLGADEGEYSEVV